MTAYVPWKEGEQFPCEARATKEAAVVALQSLQTRLREDGKDWGASVRGKGG